MYKKLVIASVLIAFVCVQLATSLECYNCNTPGACKKPGKVTCNQQTANATRQYLNQYFINVSNVTTNNFDCFNTTYTNNNSPTMELRGCAYREQNTCMLAINNTIGSTWVKVGCNICSGNLCNGNPAGTFSSSSYAIFGSVLSLMLAKMFVF